MKERLVINIFLKIYSLIKDAKRNSDVTEKIYQIYNDDPENFLCAIKVKKIQNINITLLHLAAQKGNLEAIIAISDIYLKSQIISELDTKRPLTNILHPCSIIDREIHQSKVKHYQRNEILNLKQESSCNSILHEAVFYNHFYIVRWLLDNQADPNVKNNFLETPLYYASSSSKGDESFLLLLNENSDLNLRNTKGNTVLDVLVSYNKIALIKKLLKLKTGTNNRNSFPQQVLDIACLKGNLDLVKTLIRYTQKNHIRLENIETSISAAEGPQKAEITKALKKLLKFYKVSTPTSEDIEIFHPEASFRNYSPEKLSRE